MYEQVELPSFKQREEISGLQTIVRDYEIALKNGLVDGNDLPPLLCIIRTPGGKFKIGVHLDEGGIKPYDELKWRDRLRFGDQVRELEK